VKQQHTSTATSILITKSTYRSLSAQRLSERTVEKEEVPCEQREKEDQTLLTLQHYSARNNHAHPLKYFKKNESPWHTYGRALTVTLCIPETAG
jgi:hypothetical protein